MNDIETDEQKQFRLASMQLADLFARFCIDPAKGVTIGWIRAEQETADSPLIGKMRLLCNSTGQHWEVAFNATPVDQMHVSEKPAASAEVAGGWTTADGELAQPPGGFRIQVEEEIAE